MADNKSLPGVTTFLILLGVLIATGLIIIDKFQSSEVVSTTTTVTNESFTVPLTNTTRNGTFTLANDDLVSFTQILNSSGATLGSGNYSVALTTGIVTITSPNNISSACMNGTTCYAYYVYRDVDSNVYTAISNVSSAVDDIPNNWLGVLIVAIIGAFVIGLLIRYFGQSR